MIGIDPKFIELKADVHEFLLRQLSNEHKFALHMKRGTEIVEVEVKTIPRSVSLFLNVLVAYTNDRV